MGNINQNLNRHAGHYVVDEQTGITFRKLFFAWLEGASEVVLTDPYIREEHQFQLLREFIGVLRTISNPENQISLELITTELRTKTEDGQPCNPVNNQRKVLDEIKKECAEMAATENGPRITFSWKFDDTIHARHIVSDTGWKICLDRGLDIYHGPEWRQPSWTPFLQADRFTKKFELTYIAPESQRNFEDFLKEICGKDAPVEGSVVKGKVLAIEAGQAIINVGNKLEGRVDLKEFANPGETPEITPGDEVDVYLRAAENARGEAVISREMARREEAWDRLEAAYDQRVVGTIIDSDKGGYKVDLDGVVAFLPKSQVDVPPVRDAGPLMGLKQPFQILEMNRRRRNIVVSRRTILEESRAEQRAEVIGNLSEGQTVEGVVKNITEYGAFVDLGGVDGLLRVTDLAWRRLKHPSEILTIGETIKVQVIEINKETHRISLGMKQLQDDPWDLVAAKYSLKAVHRGVVTDITDYGAFVELEAGVEGLVHMSEMSWTKKSVHPGKIVSTSQEVDVMVLEIDGAKRRVSLSLKQTHHNPWEVFSETHPGGTEVEGEVKSITKFGLVIGLEGDIDGMVHLSDISSDERGEDAIQNYRMGDVVQAVVLEVDVEKERISLSIKVLGGDKSVARHRTSERE